MTETAITDVISTPRQRSKLLGRVQDHSRNIRVLRTVLPIFAVGILFAYVVMAQPNEIDPNFQRQFSQLDDGENMRMASPSFSGEDAKGNPFEISAETAQHVPGTPESITLQNPRAIRAAGAANELSASAAIGVLRPDDKEVDLSENVEMTRGFGGDLYYLRTDKAVVGLENRTIEATSNVFGTGARGTIEADGMVIDDATGRVRFENARMVIKPKAAAEADEVSDPDVASQQKVD